MEETKSSGLSDKLRQSEEELKAANSRVAEMEAKLLQLETELEETGERWRLAMLKAEELEARVAVMQKENEALAGTIDQMQVKPAPGTPSYPSSPSSETLPSSCNP